MEMAAIMKKLKIPLLYILSFSLSVAPVLIYFFINMDKYITSVPETIKLSAGGILALILVALKVIGVLKIPSRIIVFSATFAFAYLFAAIIQDLLIFSFLALIGEIGSTICQIFIKRAKEERLTEKTAEKTAQQLEKVLNGRV